MHNCYKFVLLDKHLRDICVRVRNFWMLAKKYLSYLNYLKKSMPISRKKFCSVENMFVGHKYKSD